MWRFFYNIVLLLVSPIFVGVLLAKPRCRPGFLQRLGVFKQDQPHQPDQPVIWIHAVSLGEVVAVTPLVNELHRRYPAHRLVVSTVTETGREAVEQRLAGVAEHCY
ncbi:MAG TPA: glycosyltransferase N-terminal domain-containing protein, partial [Nitrospiraceae bacterium]|nr:glycosyltransferase N-terminal domain-containing protein [Nitrospiraceae bacterium]